MVGAEIRTSSLKLEVLWHFVGAIEGKGKSMHLLLVFSPVGW